MPRQSALLGPRPEVGDLSALLPPTTALEKTEAHQPAAAPRRGLLLLVTAASLYFLTAYAALALQSQTAGIAVFWPASGMAVGLLLGNERRWRLAIAAGVVAATLAANTLYGRSPALALVFGLCNAGEALAIDWSLRNLAEREFTLKRLADVLRLFGATIVGCGMAAAVAAMALMLNSHLDVPFIGIWRVWLLSDLVGVVVIAPLIIAIADLVRQPARHHDWSADIALLLLLCALSWNALSQQPGSWLSLAPGTTVVPAVLWIAARGQPLAPAIAVCIVAALIGVVSAMGMGQFGDPTVPAAVRVVAAQASLAALALVALLVSALFHERRHADLKLREGVERLATIAGAAPGVMFSLSRDVSGKLHFPFLAETTGSVLGLDPSLMARDARHFLDRLDADDHASLQRALNQSGDVAGPIQLEFAYRHPDHAGRWIELCAAPVVTEDGGIVWHGYAHDVTGRRTLAEELNHRTRNLLSVVQSIAQHTASTADPTQFPEQLVVRLEGLLRCHDLLGDSDWKGVDLGNLIRSQLAHLADLIGVRIQMDGPALLVQPPTAQIIGMAIHELATNAMKYGALSNAAGTIAIAWSLTGDGAAARFQLSWRESGGPGLANSGRKGFGHKVTVDMVRYQLGACVELQSHDHGIAWVVDAPAAKILHRDGDA